MKSVMHDLKPKEKREARIISLQMIYAQEFKGSDIDTSLQYMLDPESPPANTVLVYSKHLYLLTIKHMEEMDALIKERSKNWDFKRIAIMDKLILRMSLSEMLYENEVPPKVSITEGVEIAKQFSTAESSSFINGILDAIYNDIFKEEKKII